MSLQLRGTGTLRFSLAGYTNIPTDGSGRISIKDIGHTDERALICSTELSSFRWSNWYRHPLIQTTSRYSRLTDRNTQGWGIHSNSTAIKLRRKNESTTWSEGVFTCSTRIHHVGDRQIAIGIYYPSESLT